MIDEKKLEEAAQRYCNATDANKNEASLLSEGFKEGVHWFKKSLWHDASEKPEKGENCIVRVRYEYDSYLGDDDYEEYSTAVYLGGTSWSEDHFSSEADVYILRWCRISDILPTKGGEG